MAQKLINLGEMPNGMGGDTNRSANVKCNENFTELYDTCSALDEEIDRVDRSKAAIGKNADITELAGLETPMTVAQGGTGGTSGEEACLNISAIHLGSKHRSFGTALLNGLMPGIAGLGTDRIFDSPLTLDNEGNQHASCVMTFHRGGAFACFFGLDVDNRLKVGGGSFGGRAFTIYHEGNTTRAPDGTLKAV
ncbi:hypothetical protein [Pseudomonas viridiflava]|uniref:hypothetical protein n=1 Tax=Pseudomonas viridiflava TaxID=33069 RepID=UPI000F031CA8|nr:hypothetical protein [Pseudomonas viridiflava]